MILVKKIIFVALLLLLVYCDESNIETQSQKKILTVLVSKFEKNPVYHQTLEEKVVENFLKDGLSIQNIAFLSASKDSLQNHFSNQITSSLVNRSIGYKQINLTSGDLNGYPVISEEEIPDFVKDSSIPPPFKYSGFTNVNFLSTPIIYKDYAIVFHDSYGDVDIGVSTYFFKKNKNNSWELINSGIL